MNKKIFLPVMILIIIGAVVYLLPMEDLEPEVEPEDREITYHDPDIEERCEEVNVERMELDCIEAAELALEEYPGEVLQLEEGEVEKSVGETRDDMEIFDSWLFTIRLDEVTTFAGMDVREVEVSVDDEKEVFLNKFFPKSN